MTHSVNTSVVHCWRQLAREGMGAPLKADEFIALLLMALVPAIRLLHTAA